MRNLYAFGLLLASPLVGMAQTATQTTGQPATVQTAKPATATVAAGKLASEFSGWAGSQDNAAALVDGLRSGQPITLAAPGAGGTATTTTTTFSPATRPMGYGNIRIALSLAQARLASQGITNPTPEQLQGALAGDGSTQGVLQMRAAGMGWGQIANSQGVKLGAVMSGKPAAATPSPAAVTTAAGTGASPTGAQSRKGIVTASGAAAGGGPAGKSSGITTADGSGRVTSGLGHAYGRAGGGVVSAAGAKAGGAAGSNAGGNGKGGGKP